MGLSAVSFPKQSTSLRFHCHFLLTTFILVTKLLYLIPN